MVPYTENKPTEVLEQDDMDGSIFKMKDDPRITQKGHFICKTGINEEMQLIYYLEGRNEHGEIFFSSSLGDCGVHLLRETSALYDD